MSLGPNGPLPLLKSMEVLCLSLRTKFNHLVLAGKILSSRSENVDIHMLSIYPLSMYICLYLYLSSGYFSISHLPFSDIQDNKKWLLTAGPLFFIRPLVESWLLSLHTQSKSRETEHPMKYKRVYSAVFAISELTSVKCNSSLFCRTGDSRIFFVL